MSGYDSKIWKSVYFAEVYYNLTMEKEIPVSAKKQQNRNDRLTVTTNLANPKKLEVFKYGTED